LSVLRRVAFKTRMYIYSYLGKSRKLHFIIKWLCVFLVAKAKVENIAIPIIQSSHCGGRRKEGVSEQD
jgi:hypothetical protein